jgi:DNA-binding HxlR family transcriptional regulator
LFRKGAIEVISYLSKVKKTNYYSIQKQNFVGSRQTLANLLKEMEERGILNRKIIESRPPKVEYSLTAKGEETIKLLEMLDEVIKR